MSLFPLRTFLPFTNIISRCYPNFFPIPFARGNHFMTPKQMPSNPHERFYIGTGLRAQNVLLDKSFAVNSQPRLQPKVTKREGKTSEKATDVPLIRKHRRKRTMFTNEQIFEMEEFFSQCTYVGSQEAEELATRLSLGVDTVRYWFKNRRAKAKRDTIKQDPWASCEKECTTKATAAPKVVPNVSQLPPRVPALPLSETYASHNFPPPGMTSTPTQNKFTPSISPQQHCRQQSYFHQKQLNGPSPLFDFSDQSFTTTTNNSGTSDYFSEMSSCSSTYEQLTASRILDETVSLLKNLLDRLRALKNPTIRYNSCNYNCNFRSKNILSSRHKLHVV